MCKLQISKIFYKIIKILQHDSNMTKKNNISKLEKILKKKLM